MAEKAPVEKSYFCLLLTSFKINLDFLFTIWGSFYWNFAEIRSHFHVKNTSINGIIKETVIKLLTSKILFIQSMLQVTPPEEPLPVLGVPCVSGGINPSGFGGSSLGISSLDSISSPLQIPQEDRPMPSAPSPQHLQGTIVWYNLMWGRRLRSAVGKNKWI